MRRSNPKIEWAALSALAFALIYATPNMLFFFSVLVFCTTVIAEIIRFALKRHLAVGFQFPFLLVVILTTLEIFKYKLRMVTQIEISFAAIPIVLMLHVPGSIRDRLETGFLFLIYSFLLAAFGITGRVLLDSLLPVTFLVISFVMVTIRWALLMTKKGLR